MDWRTEIVELHDFFQAYFLGQEDSLDRVEAALHGEFSIVGPDGAMSDRAATLEMLRGGHAHTEALTITTLDHRLLHTTPELVLASYVEHHQLTSTTNDRLSTVAFLVDPAGPNGVRWLRVHETWLDHPGA